MPSTLFSSKYSKRYFHMLSTLNSSKYSLGYFHMLSTDFPFKIFLYARIFCNITLHLLCYPLPPSPHWFDYIITESLNGFHWFFSVLDVKRKEERSWISAWTGWDGCCIPCRDHPKTRSSLSPAPYLSIFAGVDVSSGRISLAVTWQAQWNPPFFYYYVVGPSLTETDCYFSPEMDFYK